jgi:hypothetical protein
VSGAEGPKVPAGASAGDGLDAREVGDVGRNQRVAGRKVDGSVERRIARVEVVGDRELPHGQVESSSLSFTNVGSGDVVVRFEEIPLTG